MLQQTACVCWKGWGCWWCLGNCAHQFRVFSSFSIAFGTSHLLARRNCLRRASLHHNLSPGFPWEACKQYGLAWPVTFTLKIVVGKFQDTSKKQMALIEGARGTALQVNKDSLADSRIEIYGRKSITSRRGATSSLSSAVLASCVAESLEAGSCISEVPM